MYTVVSPHVCLRVCLYECTQTCVYACTCACIRAYVLAKAVLYSEMALRMGGVGHAASVTLRGSRKAQALQMGGGGARKLRFWRYVISGRPLTQVSQKIFVGIYFAPPPPCDALRNLCTSPPGLSKLVSHGHFRFLRV